MSGCLLAIAEYVYKYFPPRPPRPPPDPPNTRRPPSNSHLTHISIHIMSYHRKPINKYLSLSLPSLTVHLMRAHNHRHHHYRNTHFIIKHCRYTLYIGYIVYLHFHTTPDTSPSHPTHVFFFLNFVAGFYCFIMLDHTVQMYVPQQSCAYHSLFACVRACVCRFRLCIIHTFARACVLACV